MNFFFLFFLVRSFSSTSSKEISRLVHVRTFSHKMGQTKLPSCKTDWHLYHEYSVHTAFYLWFSPLQHHHHSITLPPSQNWAHLPFVSLKYNKLIVWGLNSLDRTTIIAKSGERCILPKWHHAYYKKWGHDNLGTTWCF